MAVLKVLVVDDEPGIRSGVARILNNFRVGYSFVDEDFTFEVTEAATGEDGIKIIDDDRPDIVLLDNKLPGIQGIEVLEYIRNKNYDMAVAMITSCASLDVALKAYKFGATDFILKPFTPRELKSSVENITKQLYLKKITHKMNEEDRKVKLKFLSVLSHELKAPLNAVEGYLKMMQERQSGDRIEDYTIPIERSLQRIHWMKSLIMDLLDFTRIRLERKDEKIEEVHLKDIASNAIVAIRPYAIRMEVGINLGMKSDVIIMADPTDMEIIFNNLVSNAVKYNRRGGKVDIVIDEDEENVILLFADTGIGISEPDRKNLFSDFVRIKNEKTKNIGGSGLGLSIVKQVLDMYHGSITVDSVPDVGTTFRICLPKKFN